MDPDDRQRLIARSAVRKKKKVLFFLSSMYPTNLPILDVMLCGNPSASMCSANACAATFSLVRIIRFKLGSNTSNPTTKMAADLVLPAPNTPLMGRSVRPSKSANTNEPIVARTCSSGLHSRGCIAYHKASLSQPIANFRRFTAAEKRSALLLGTSGTCGRVHWRPHPTLNLSIGMLMKTSNSLALRLSPMK